MAVGFPYYDVTTYTRSASVYFIRGSGATHTQIYFNSQLQESSQYSGTFNLSASWMQPNTTYSFLIGCYNINTGESSGWQTVYFTTKSEIVYPSAPSVWIDNITHDSARVNFTRGSDATHTEMLWRGTTYTSTASSSYWTLPGLSPNTEYSVQLRSYNSTHGTYSSYTTRDSTTLAQKLPAPAPTNAGVYFSGTNMIAYADEKPWIGRLSFDKRVSNINNNQWRGDDFWGTGMSKYHNCAGLAPGARVEIRCRYYPVTSDYEYVANWAYCGGWTRPTRPSNFPWTSRTAGKPFDITASTWNSFANKINEFRYYRVVPQPGYIFTTAYSGNPVKASMFNELLDAINDMTTISVYTKYPGDPIKASDFNHIVYSLNAIE